MNADLNREAGNPDLTRQEMDLAILVLPRQLFLIEQAAASGGKSYAEFVVDRAAARAEYVLGNHSRLVSSEMSLAAVWRAMDSPAFQCPRVRVLLGGEDIRCRRSVVEKLGLGLDLSGFDCGYSELNDWLLDRALPGQFMRWVDTYVVRDGRTVLGSYALGVETLATHRPLEGVGGDAMTQTVSALIPSVSGGR